MRFFRKLLGFDSTQNMSINQWFFFLLIVSAVIGPAISYKSLYAFHLVLLANFLYHFFQPKAQTVQEINNFLKFENKMNYFILFSLLYFLIWIPFAENQTYALKHFVFMLEGLCLTLFIVIYIKNSADFNFLFRSIVFIYVVDMVVGVLEALQIFRWPISRLSTINNWFGRENQLQQILDEAPSHEYVHSMPTGFHWNPNNFATFMLFGLPFFLLHRNYWKSLLGIVIILLLIVASGSKSAFLGAILIFFFSLVFLRLRSKNILTLFLCVCFLSTNGFHLLQGKYTKLDEIQVFVYSGIGVSVESKKVDINNVNKSSEEYRLRLIEEGVNIFKENPIFGIGGGNAQSVIEKKGGVGEKKVSNLHNFWLELLVEGGLIYFSVFLVWLILLMKKYIFFLKKKSENSQMKYWVRAFLLSAVGFLVSGIGPSSMIGYLPLYLFLGVALTLYYLNSDNQRLTR